jgi:amidophosphoribosyltransferase
MVPILPTPPRSNMLPLLPTPSVVAALVALSTMPGRADFVQRWDAIKKYKNPCSSTSSSSESGGSPSSADTVDRWDADRNHKKPSPASSSSSDSGGSPGRANSIERWDIKKLKTPSRTSPDLRRLQDGSNKRPPSRASSAERWDFHKKHRPEEMEYLPQTVETATESFATTTTAASHKEMDMMQQFAFAGPNFYASPDPIMLPMPSFFLRAL